MPGRRRKCIFILIVSLIVVPLAWLLSQYDIFESPDIDKVKAEKPVIISRSEWGARPLDPDAPQEYGIYDPEANPEGIFIYNEDLKDVLNTIVIHHSAYSGAGPTDIQNLHKDGRGFADVGYHFMIDSEGIIYEGREINIRGAHVQGFNNGSVGIVLLGNFNEDEPSKTQLTSLWKLVDTLRTTYDIHYLAGHRDYPNQSPDGTECPGDNLYPLLQGQAREMGLKYGIEGYEPPEPAPH